MQNILANSFRITEPQFCGNAVLPVILHKAAIKILSKFIVRLSIGVSISYIDVVVRRFLEQIKKIHI